MWDICSPWSLLSSILLISLMYIQNSSGMQATYFRTLQLAPHHCGRSPRDNGRQILHRYIIFFLQLFYSLVSGSLFFPFLAPILLLSHFRLEMFASLATEFVWYVSGTPFPNLSTSNGLVDFLRFPATAYSR